MFTTAVTDIDLACVREIEKNWISCINLIWPHGAHMHREGQVWADVRIRRVRANDPYVLISFSERFAKHCPVIEREILPAQLSEVEDPDTYQENMDIAQMCGYSTHMIICRFDLNFFLKSAQSKGYKQFGGINGLPFGQLPSNEDDTLTKSCAHMNIK